MFFALFSFIILFFVFLIGMSIALSFGKEYLIWIIVFFILMCLSVISMALFIPKAREENAANELLRYDLASESVEDKPEYEFTQRECFQRFNVNCDKSEDNSLETFGKSVDFVSYIQSYLQIVSYEKIKQIKERPVSVIDNSDTSEYTHYEVRKKMNPDGTCLIESFVIYTILFNDEGINVNGSLFPYSDVTATASAYVYRHVFVNVNFSFANEKNLELVLKFDKTAIHILRKFGIKILNNDFYNELLYNPVKAFTKILKQSEKNR